MAAASALGVVAAMAPAVASTVTTTDTAVTVDTPYVKANGSPPSTGDAILLCGGNKRQQNEPSAAVDPTSAESKTVVAGSNDYCTVPGAGGTWAGFYRSTDSGASWTDSLLPGYPTDESPEGQASPLHQKGITNAGDPVQAWDNGGNLFYMGNAFNRVAPQNASVWVATYDQHAAHYVRTVIVGKGTPAPQGQFNDKTSIEVDRGVSSPNAGNVYTAWSVFQGAGNNEIRFARSTDHGATFSNPMKISEGVHGNQFADIAVTSNGTVYVAWRQFEGQGFQRDAVVYVKSTDGGQSFSKPAVAQYFESFDAADTSGNPAAAAAAHQQAYENADGPGAEAGAEEQSVGNARDCGSGPFACKSGFVFFRHDSQPRITADPKASDQTVYLVYDAIRGETQDATTTYNTAPADGGPPQVGQGAIFFSKLTGGSWSTPEPLAAQPSGHQFFPDINADDGVLHAVWHDSRNDPAYSVQFPPGNDGRTRDAQGFATHTAGLDTYAASSADGGTSWQETRLSQKSQMPNYEMFGDRRVPFHGDYNYVSSVGKFAYNVWTDTRQVVGGDDPRYLGGETFDVNQCRAPNGDGTFGPDSCPNAGGLDQDIYGAATSSN